ncbi:Cytochrome P450 monooxygenase easM [Lasiodiplodia hormozganensis]|uniref:Cytochrome P450 monooxygenase easM n=1 Tax=Lasiodiplodia hormozganensis TaxID=869390 RepID=A0AA39YJI1_9PEZI|nr:Cytochrome P450 monooxygenase easM [Lasiodiplodia hormozganensis]
MSAKQQMKLMDSCLKEIFMTREVMTTVTLSDGPRLPNGATIGIPNFSVHVSDDIYTPYENPDTFDGRSFLELREKNNDIKWQSVTTSPDQFGFGHGKQAW